MHEAHMQQAVRTQAQARLCMVAACFLSYPALLKGLYCWAHLKTIDERGSYVQESTPHTSLMVHLAQAVWTQGTHAACLHQPPRRRRWLLVRSFNPCFLVKLCSFTSFIHFNGTAKMCFIARMASARQRSQAALSTAMPACAQCAFSSSWGGPARCVGPNARLGGQRRARAHS